jgi:CMP/dCMP kinase
LGGIITIDGPSGVGKSTVSRALAEILDYLYLDTGAMYRAVALAASRASIGLLDGPALAEMCTSLDLNFKTVKGEWRICIGDEDVSAAIRSLEMDGASSEISTVREVREAMTILQRRIAYGVPVVAEGRDMGTVVFPDARHKFFLTAPAEIRARRRYLERLDKGESVQMEVVASQMQERDERDCTRKLSPLKPAEDAVVIETESLKREEVVALILKHINPDIGLPGK